MALLTTPTYTYFTRVALLRPLAMDLFVNSCTKDLHRNLSRIFGSCLDLIVILPATQAAHTSSANWRSLESVQNISFKEDRAICSWAQTKGSGYTYFTINACELDMVANTRERSTVITTKRIYIYNSVPYAAESSTLFTAESLLHKM